MDQSIGYEVFLTMPKEDGALKLTFSCTNSCDCSKNSIPSFYQLVNREEENNGADVLELWAEDKEVKLGGG